MNGDNNRRRLTAQTNREPSKKRKKKKSRKLIIYFIIFEIVFLLASAPIIVFYGPFSNLKKQVVGTAMSTMSHQYIATTFLSQSQINEILYGTSETSNEQAENLNQINLKKNDGTIELNKIEGNKFTGLMLIVHDPKRVKIGYSSKLGEKGEKTSQIAKANNAIAAINGGGFSDKGQNSTALWTGTGAFPTGFIISGGKLIYPKTNVDMNVQYPGVAGINNKGCLVVGKHSIKELLNSGVQEAICFGPTLIINNVAQKLSDINGKSIDSQGTDPRTAVGQRASDGAIVLLTIDGRQGLQAGATIGDVIKAMQQVGVTNAVNLDGGASTTLYYNGSVQNSPSDKFGERSLPTIIYVK